VGEISVRSILKSETWCGSDQGGKNAGGWSKVTLGGGGG